VVVPHFQRAGWPVRRVLTDGGPEFKGAFDVACRDLGLRHTRTKPRHAWTNGFVERLQGTILQELWRVAFRRHDFTTRAALQQALDGFMRYYNTERPHQGYRLRGCPPAALLWGVATQLAHSSPLWDGGSVNTVPSLDKLVLGHRRAVCLGRGIGQLATEPTRVSLHAVSGRSMAAPGPRR
jgi:hypothetical protein